MRCPICGARMINGQVCPYCKIVDKQVYGASNKKVKEYREKGYSDLICYTNVLPSDVSKLKLILYTIFFGWCGVNHFLVNRPVRAWYSLVTSVLSLFIIFFNAFYVEKTLAGEWIVWILYNAFLVSMAINVVMWFCDIIGVLLKRFKVPVVLPEKGDVK